MSYEDKIKELDIKLPEAKAPAGNYVATKIIGKMLFISGQISINENGELIKGKVGKALDTDAAYDAAKRWPHMFLTLSPTYVGLAQAAVDFTIKYLRGELPNTPPVKRRMFATKQITVAEMEIQLENIQLSILVLLEEGA